MTAESRVSVRWTVLGAGALGLLALGAGATYIGLGVAVRAPAVVGGRAGTIGSVRPVSPPNREAATAPLADLAVPLTTAGAERAGITFATVTADGTADGLRAPGVVEPNAYKVVDVTPLAGGRVTRIAVVLGQHVQQGQSLAEIFSPELAEWQTRYITVRADLEAHERELARVEKLVQIGSASRQELERIHAEHAAQRAGLQSAASRLRLFGLSESAIEALDPGRPLDATVNVLAPMAGVVTARNANLGANVNQSTALVTIVDLSTVWVVVDVYEGDFARVQIGAPVRVTTSAYPNLKAQGRVSYIDPQVTAASRTARVRVEVPNPRGELRFGMLVEAAIGGETGASLLIPQRSVQHVGDRSVVYFVDPQNERQFIEREVRLGATSGDRTSVLAGLRLGDVVVTEGSFAVRAERERLGLRSGTDTVTDGQPASEAAPVVKILVGEQGYEPARVSVRAGVAVRLTFLRTTDKTCGTEIVFPSLGIKRPLPLNEPVVIEFTAEKAGEVPFTCGMNMLKGVVIVQ